MSQGNPFENWVRSLVDAARSEYDQKLGRLAGAMRHEQAKTAQKQLEDLSAIARALTVDRTGSGIARIEDLPGLRIPYDLLVDIPVGANTASIREGSITISQDGPFVAVKRYATFQSAHQFQTTVNGVTSTFNGRSFGRYRPIHSAWDIFDAQGPGIPLATPAVAGGFTNAVLDGPGLMSGFRTMEFDGRVLMENAGASRPRQNLSVPTSLWTPQINAPQDLGCLDFFERGEVITFKIQPNHVNNPPFGNVDGFDVSGTAGWSFLGGQFDKHEGIVTPGLDLSHITIVTDPVVRLPDGIITIGFLGYRIFQPTGPVG